MAWFVRQSDRERFRLHPFVQVVNRIHNLLLDRGRLGEEARVGVPAHVRRKGGIDFVFVFSNEATECLELLESPFL